MQGHRFTSTEFGLGPRASSLVLAVLASIPVFVAVLARAAAAPGGLAFAEGESAKRLLLEKAAGNVDIGLPVSATTGDGHRLTYGLGGTDADSLALDPRTGQLRTRSGIDYDNDVKSSYNVTVRAEDGRGGSATIAVEVEVVDVLPVADAGWDLTVGVGGTAWLDGTGSSVNQGTLAFSWSFVSWPGATAPALDGGTTSTPSFVAAAEGTYLARLAVSAGGIAVTDDVAVTVRAVADASVLVVADLLVDTNRDGAVDSLDEAGEETWDRDSGAVFGPNADDDDGDGNRGLGRDGWDGEANGDDDLPDMAPVVARRIPGLNRRHAVEIEMDFTGQSGQARLFLERLDGTVEMLVEASGAKAALPSARLAAGDLQLWLEGRLGRDIGFDGRLSLELTVEEGSTEVSEDVVALRGGPILFGHNAQAADRVFVVEPSATLPSEPLLDALGDHLPDSVALYRHDPPNKDPWFQDSMETGYASAAPGSAPSTTLVHTNLHRTGGLRMFLEDVYLGPGTGFAKPGGDRRHSANAGGNIDVIPPHTHGERTWPFGRIVVGGELRGSAMRHTMVQNQVDFLQAQEAQTPLIVVDVGWLLVGHVDEVFSVVPNLNAGTDERSWAVAIASPSLGVSLLEQAVEDGHGDLPFFEGRSSEETSAELLADTELMAQNDAAQAKIDTVRAKLVQEVGLEDDDFREVPALVEAIGGRSAPVVPMMQNLLVATDVAFVADPEGPEVDGEDLWQRAMLDALDGLGLKVHFVDTYDNLHWGRGGIHCATNVERAPYADPWWRHAAVEEASP